MSEATICPDVYTIFLRESIAPQLPKSKQILPFQFQKFHFNSLQHRYEPVLAQAITLNLSILNCQPKKDSYCSFPYLLNARPQAIPYPEQYPELLSDPILHSLHPFFRMVFRYSPDRNLGCLVHYGCDFGQPESYKSYPLWLTALNLQEFNPHP